jgi:hypothetical protein
MNECHAVRLHNVATSARLEARAAYPQTSPRVLLQASFTEEVMPTSYPPSNADGDRHAAFHGLVDGYLDSPSHTDFARVISTGEQYFPESSLTQIPQPGPSEPRIKLRAT